MAMNQAQIEAELRRKASLGKPPTDPKNMDRYNQIVSEKPPSTTQPQPLPNKTSPSGGNSIIGAIGNALKPITQPVTNMVNDAFKPITQPISNAANQFVNNVNTAADNFKQNPQQLQFANFWTTLQNDAAKYAQNQIAEQIKAFQNQVDQQRLLTQQQTAANQSALQENIGKMQQVNNQNDFRIAENENRFGGTYSGGLRLQQAANDTSTNEAIEAATRDVQTRNANIWRQYGQLAQQASEKIAALSQQTPALVQDYISRQLQNASSLGALTGQTPMGTPTFAAQQADRNFGLAAQGQMFDQGMQTAQFNHQVNRDARKDYETDRLFEYGVYRDNVSDAQWSKQFEESVKARAEQMGYNWANLAQREKELIADQQARELEINRQQMDKDFDRGLEIYNSTGQMPTYMAEYGVNVDGMNDADTKAEIEGLYLELSNGSVTPEQALQRLNDAEKLGLKDSSTINELRNTVYMLAPESNPEYQKKQKEEQKERQKNRTEGIMEFFTPSLTASYQDRLAQLRKIFGG